MSLDLSNVLLILDTGGVLRTNVVPKPLEVALLLSLASDLLLTLPEGLGVVSHLQILVVLGGVVLAQDLVQVQLLEAVDVLDELVGNHLLVAQGALTFLEGLLTLLAVGLVLLGALAFLLSIHFGGVLIKG